MGRYNAWLQYYVAQHLNASDTYTSLQFSTHTRVFSAISEHDNDGHSMKVIVKKDKQTITTII